EKSVKTREIRIRFMAHLTNRQMVRWIDNRELITAASKNQRRTNSFNSKSIVGETMLKRVLAAAAAVFVLAGVSRADEYKGTIKKVDAERGSIVLTVGGEEKTFTVAKDAEIYTQQKGKKNKPGPKDPVSGGLGGLKDGSDVTLITIKSGDKEIVSAIK